LIDRFSSSAYRRLNRTRCTRGNKKLHQACGVLDKRRRGDDGEDETGGGRRTSATGKTAMSNADLVELYLLKRDSLESDEKRMIIGLLGFVAPVVPTPPPAAIPVPGPVVSQPVIPPAPTPPVLAPRGFKLSDETRRKMSTSAKARHARSAGGGFRKGYKHSEETRRKMSESAKARIARDNGAHIKKMHETVRDALALARREASVPPMGHPRGWERSDGCEFTSKKRYPNKGAAEADIARLRGKPGLKPIRTYSCPCGGWHTTSQEERGAGPERIR